MRELQAAAAKRAAETRTGRSLQATEDRFHDEGGLVAPSVETTARSTAIGWSLRIGRDQELRKRQTATPRTKIHEAAGAFPKLQADRPLIQANIQSGDVVA